MSWKAQMGMTLREACVLAVGILGGCPTTSEVHGFLAQDGWPVSKAAVKMTLYDLRGTAVDVAVQGRAGYGQPTRWRQAEAARARVAGDDRCGA